MTKHYSDIVIVGGGSAGFGAAMRAVRENPSAGVMLIEASDRLGGTSTIGGVNCWEPGIAGLGVHYELYGQLRSIPNAIGVGRTTKYYTKETTYGLSQIDTSLLYESSLRRSAHPRDQWRRVHFEPEAMSTAMEELLQAKSPAFQIQYRTRLIAASVANGRITSITVQTSDGEQQEIEAKLFIDCSGGIHLALASQCCTSFGEDSEAAYGEPSAPESPGSTVNGVTLVYRAGKAQVPQEPDIVPDAEAAVDEAWAWVREKQPPTAINEYPNGDLNLNVLPVMEGELFHSMPYEEARQQCLIRAKVHWLWLKSFRSEFADYRFRHAFPLVGIRESHRLVGRYVLREQDVRAGLLRQTGQDEFIAFADHALDTHGGTRVKGPRLGELEQPYGIPYSCLLPQELDNLIVASRGASFSHIAASSCRLSRTMMELGEAAGTAAALALAAGTGFPGVNRAELQRRLRIEDYRAKIISAWF